MITERQQREAASEFAARWQGKGYEKGESQRFWLDLLGSVFGVERPTEAMEFEDKVRLDKTAFIDVMIPATHVMIEQKSLGKDLRKPIRQSDGSLLTPFQQAQRYSAVLPYSERPRWIVTCNFEEFDVYDMENPNGEPQRILLKDLGKEYYRLQFLVDTGSEHLKKEMEVSMRAGENKAGLSGQDISRLPLETCQTMNDSWGYDITDKNYKSADEIIRLLVNTAGRNANLLLNIGPRPDGKLPQESLDRLKAIGKWLHANGESIYGTRGGVVTPRDWGVTTQKGKTLYVHILNLQDASLFLPVENVKRAVMFADKSPVKVTRCPGGVTLSFSAIPSGVDTIVKVSLK